MVRDRYLQALRGAAIAAVVLIHSLPACAASVAVRPFLNWSVAMFLFLSGYLTNEFEIKRGGCSPEGCARPCRPMSPVARSTRWLSSVTACWVF